MSSSAAQAQISSRSLSTYTEYELIKALDEWVFDAYKITQPVHQKIIRFWARRINFKKEIRKQIGQGETIGIKDETTADRVNCSTRVVSECRRLAKKSGLLTYQKKHSRIGVWIMYFDCMIKPKPIEISDDDGVITGLFDQAENDEIPPDEGLQSTESQVHFSEDNKAKNPDYDKVPENSGDLREKHFSKTNNNNTTTIVPRDTITDHANDESVVAEESKELIKDSHPEGNQTQTKLFEVWELNRIRHKREIPPANHQKHYDQIGEVIEWAIEKKYCTRDDAADKLRPIFDNATKQFSVPVGLIKSDEGRQVFKDAFPAPESTKLSPNDPGYYDQDAMNETRNRHKEKARQIREKGAAYGWSKTDKPALETTPEPEQVEEPKTNGNGGGGSMSPAERKAWLRENVRGLNDVQPDKKSSFGNATEVMEETKKKIRETQATQMDLFDLPVLDNE